MLGLVPSICAIQVLDLLPRIQQILDTRPRMTPVWAKVLQ
jgi:hypothetical protein